MVDKYASELETWYASKTDDYQASDFFHEQNLDNPYAFMLEDVLKALDEVS